MLTRATRATFVVTCLAMASGHVLAQKPVTDPLADGFRNPPNAARPRVWWHWMDGNITKEGIKLDLEWLHRVGIGGVTLFDAALGGKQVVGKRLVYMTPEWQDAIRYAVQTADSLGLDVTIATSAGWSETGGPWVKPADAMKKLVWSETDCSRRRAACRSAAAPADGQRAVSAGCPCPGIRSPGTRR